MPLSSCEWLNLAYDSCRCGCDCVCAPPWAQHMYYEHTQARGTTRLDMLLFERYYSAGLWPISNMCLHVPLTVKIHTTCTVFDFSKRTNLYILSLNIIHFPSFYTISLIFLFFKTFRVLWKPFFFNQLYAYFPRIHSIIEMQ